MVMLCCRYLVDILFCIKHNLTSLCAAEIVNHRISVNTFLQTEIHHGILAGIKQIIAFILRIMYAEILMGELIGGMYLQTEIASTHSVKEIKAYGKLLSEARLNLLTKQLPALYEDHILGRQLHLHAAYIEKHTVFFRHTVETPSIIGHFAIEIAHIFHPLTAPRSWIKERNNPEWSCHGTLHTFKKHIMRDHLHLCRIGVKPIIYPSRLYKFQLNIVTDVPIIEVASLVLHRRTVVPIVNSKGFHFMATEPLLYLPPRHIGINYRISLRSNIARARTYYNM